MINYLGNKKPLIGGVQSKTRRTMKIVQSVRGEGCGGHSIVHWNNVPVIVPPVPPSRLDACNIIEVQYLVRVSYPTCLSLSKRARTGQTQVRALVNKKAYLHTRKVV